MEEQKMAEMHIDIDPRIILRKKNKIKRKIMLGKKKKYIKYSIPCLKDWENLNVDMRYGK